MIINQTGGSGASVNKVTIAGLNISKSVEAGSRLSAVRGNADVIPGSVSFDVECLTLGEVLSSIKTLSHTESSEKTYSGGWVKEVKANELKNRFNTAKQGLAIWDDADLVRVFGEAGLKPGDKVSCKARVKGGAGKSVGHEIYSQDWTGETVINAVVTETGMRIESMTDPTFSHSIKACSSSDSFGFYFKFSLMGITANVVRVE